MQKIVGIDLGFGFCKVYSDNGRHIFPSIAGPCNEEVLRVSGVRNPAYEHETVFLDNKKFLVGNSAARYSERVYQARDKDWIDSFTYRCLLHHALRLAGVNNPPLTPQETVIVTGLPVTHYRSCRPKLIDLVKSMTHPDVSVKVTLQPLGSYFDHLLCDDGGIQDMELVHNRVGVIDIGFYTSDFITVESLELVKNLLETREGGMSSVYQEIARDIFNSHGIRKETYEVERVVADGYVKVYGEKKSIADIVRPRFERFAREIESTARILWKDGADIDRILVTGGGSEDLKDYLEFYKHATFMSGGQFANVRGYVKFARSLKEV